MCKLSVNVNKVATLRNARGGNVPDLLKVSSDIESFGSQGITIHPRPDERHIRYQDARDLKKIVQTELNIEGNPIDSFTELVLEVKPDQVTLVPDAVTNITSDAGWDTIKNAEFLKKKIALFKSYGIRTSVFVNPDVEMVEGAKEVGADRIELYTEAYAVSYENGDMQGVNPYVKAAAKAHELGLEINAGHDLSLKNIEFFVSKIPHLAEVSIGHALIAESLYLGLENVVGMYLRKIENGMKSW